MKQEQLRTDVNFGLRSHPIDLTGTGGATDLSAGLVAYYPFNGNTNDESGYGNNVVSSDGDISLTVGVTGNQEGAYHFNGGRMEVLNSESLQFSRACTFSAYIRPTEYTSSDGYSCGCVVGKSYDQVGATMLEYDIWKDSISTNIGIHGNNVNYNYIDQNRQRLGVKGDFLNKWIHIANVIDGNRALYYINGKLVWEHAITTPEFFNTVNQNDMFIGKNRAGWYGMRGDIDEVRIYNRALSPSEVQQLAVYGEEPQTDQPIAQNGCPDGNHPHMIDLGLPSGTKWACCNVGASSPEEYGDYFAWGETEPKDEYNWDTYKYCNGSDDTMTKYCFESNYGYNGFTDNLTELLPEDDAATANWGSGWQMPSTEQLEELIYNEYTTTEWTKQNGVNGLLITSEVNGNSLFLRAAGYRYDTSLEYAGVYGLYWPRSLGTGRSYGVRSLHIDSMINYASNCHRCCGFSVRPVCAQN